MLRASLVCTLVLVGCGAPTRLYDSEAIDSGADGALDTTAETAAPGDLGAVCKVDGDCLSKFCLAVGRCSKACPTAGICPNSSNWLCLVVPTRGPMCECDVLSPVDVACNGIDDNCDGKIDEDSPTCGGKCVDTRTDPKNCGACDKVCEGGSTCKDSVCECSADKPKMCGMKCVDTKTDAANCGACEMPCGTGEVCLDSVCAKPTSVDVTVLLDVTGSNTGQLNIIKATLNARLVEPLLKLGNVQVGVSYTAEFPTDPYGQAGDQPFKGGIEPTATEAMVTPLITTFPMMNGNDEADGMVEALATLSGLGVHPTSTALTCSAGRTAGGCWRADAKKVIVIVSDSIFHNAPDPMTPTMLFVPYVGITPAPKDWPAVLKALTTQKTVLLFMNTTFGTMASKAQQQWEILLKDLGQPVTDVYPSNGDAAAMTASDNIVKRVTAIKGP